MNVTELCVYPVKSMAPVTRSSCVAQARGFIGDRRWMVTDPAGRFVTARLLSKLVVCRAAPSAEGITLTLEGDTIAVAVPQAAASAKDVVVWRDTVQAYDAGEQVAAWLSDKCGRALRLVYQADHQHRWLGPGKALADGDQVSFADGYPLLLIGSASLQDLNRRLAKPVTMRHFRPNIVVETDVPFVEDSWRSVAIGPAVFDVASACARCVLTTVDPATGIRRDDAEPLRTLRGYRQIDADSGKIMFGMNLVTRVAGEVSVGDPVRIIARRIESLR